MSHTEELARRHAQELRGLGGELAEVFTAAAAALEAPLGAEGLHAWTRAGLGLARRSSASRAAGAAFFAASPAAVSLGSAGLCKWADLAADLADRAPEAAIAFVEATPAALDHLESRGLASWARQGRRLCRGTWKSTRLAASFFRLGPELLASVGLDAMERLVEVVAELARTSDEMASLCLRDTVPRLAQLAEPDREPFLALVQAVCRASGADTHRCIDRGPALLEPFPAELRGSLIALAEGAAPEAGPEALALFAAAARALASLEPETQAEVVELARRVAPHAPRAAIELLASSAEVRRRLPPEQATRWSQAGVALATAGRSPEGIGSYFRLQSALAEEMLAELAGRVELPRVAGTLRLYAKALTGQSLLVQPGQALVGRGIGWSSEMLPTGDGVSIYLPPEIDLFGDQRANFQAYKVQTTHQVGRLEFGSFRYRFGVDGALLPSTALDRERRRRQAGKSSSRGAASRDARTREPPAVTAMQHLYDLFDDRGLASELFVLAEDARIDACIAREYAGIRRGLRRLQDHEAGRRGEVQRMPLRQAFVENLVRVSLGHAQDVLWPAGLAARLERAVATLRLVGRDLATVQDSAEVAARLYDLAIAVPNLPPERAPGAWSALDEEAVSRAAALSDTPFEDEAALPAGAELEYRSPGRPGYRGDFKPELVQLLGKLADPRPTAEDGSPLTRDQILELLEGSTELELEAESEDAGEELETLLANIERQRADDAGEEEAINAVEEDDDPSIAWFRYDEWDFEVGDYRPDWCRVGERRAAEGELEFYDETLRRHHGLVVETRRQFELMRPESFRRLRRLEDGHEIDLDEAIEFHADKRAGVGPHARFYTRRNKIKRDVAVGFLLDMSGSTGEEIAPPPSHRARRADTRRGDSHPQRIIDLEREAAVLVVEALEAIGDSYALYGFSGYGRENIEFHVIKDLDETLDDSVLRRIDGIEPIRSTRMGPAIRHTITKLEDFDAKVKILILVSDGRPQDEEYGRDPAEREYAVHDTRQALLEAKRRRIAPFLITVDSAGHDYLRTMCDDMGYEVVADIESLPRRLPRLYRHVAAE